MRLTLYSSSRNLLGPHLRLKEILERMEPEDFKDERNWTSSYNFVPFGLIRSSSRVQVFEIDEKQGSPTTRGSR